MECYRMRFIFVNSSCSGPHTSSLSVAVVGSHRSRKCPHQQIWRHHMNFWVYELLTNCRICLWMILHFKWFFTCGIERMAGNGTFSNKEQMVALNVVSAIVYHCLVLVNEHLFTKTNRPELQNTPAASQQRVKTAPPGHHLNQRVFRKWY